MTQNRRIAILLIVLLIGSVARLQAQPQMPGNAPAKIGVLTELSGPYSDFSGRGSIAAAEMAVRDFGGSVLGRPVVVISADHQGKPDLALTIARRWFDEDGVTAITDISGSPVALAVESLATEKRRLALNATASTDALTNASCSPFSVSWTYDSYSFSNVLASVFAKPASTWFFLTVDNAGGRGLENALTPFLTAAGAKVVGHAYVPLGTSDMSAFLLNAQASGAQYIALANAGADMQNMLKQASEFGVTREGQQLIGMVVGLSDLSAMGLQLAGGLMFPAAFVADARPESRAWADRYSQITGKMPSSEQAGVYSVVSHYLKAVQAAGTTEPLTVMAKMRELPVEDVFTAHGVLREDGRMVHDLFLVRAKSPQDSAGPRDLITVVDKIPGEKVFRSPAASACHLLKP